MYITNPNIIPQYKIYKCKKQISDWLQKQGIPLLSKEGEFYIYSKTENLENILIRLPLWLKIYT